ncbi:MAG TPA: class I SAM-dependent methyltransferase, partial [Candidatus Acetothermia bacterium]|nr:class I SAM-dependent methyltransferase [Candidatus Acetothermia bacterium]
MREWFEESFGREYLSLYPHRDDVEARCDVERIVRLISPPKERPLLDLGCGSGRHLIAFREAGFRDLTGLDLSTALLQEAEERLRQHSITDVRLIQRDMRDIPEGDRFFTIVSLFTSFGYFRDRADNLAVLQGACRALLPGGHLLVDTLNRDQVLQSLRPEERRCFDGREIAIRRWITPDGLRVEKSTCIRQSASAPTVYRESVRLYSESEVRHLMSQA